MTRNQSKNAGERSRKGSDSDPTGWQNFANQSGPIAVEIHPMTEAIRVQRIPIVVSKRQTAINIKILIKECICVVLRG
jgi:hypothetical protein